MSEWDTMTDNAKEAWLAENVMGWHVGGKGWVDARKVLLFSARR